MLAEKIYVCVEMRFGDSGVRNWCFAVRLIYGFLGVRDFETRFADVIEEF